MADLFGDAHGLWTSTAGGSILKSKLSSQRDREQGNIFTHYCHPELVSGSAFILINFKVGWQMLKQVQHDRF